MGKYTTFDVARIFKIDRTRLQEWIDKGFISPETPAAGKGTKALFSRDQLYSIKLAYWLLKAGKQRRDAFEIADICWENIGTKQGQFRYLVIDYRVLEKNLSAELGGDTLLPKYPADEMTDPDVFRFVINLIAVIREVDLAIDQDRG